MNCDYVFIVYVLFKLYFLLNLSFGKIGNSLISDIIYKFRLFLFFIDKYLRIK